MKNLLLLLLFFKLFIGKCDAQPAQILYLEALPTNISNPIVVSWATALENNLDYFIVQRSFTGLYFIDVDTTQAAGTSTIQRDYSFNDIVPFPDTFYYYRLKMVDNDGLYEYTSIVSAHVFSITFIGDEFSNQNIANIFPNPSNGKFMIELQNQTNLRAVIILSDLFGKELIRFTPTEDIEEISLPFPDGVYLLNITCGKMNYRKKIVMQK